MSDSNPNSTDNSNNSNNNQSNKHEFGNHLPALTSEQYAHEFHECLNDMKLGLGSNKELGKQWKRGMRNKKHSQLDELWKLGKFESVYKIKMSDFIISPEHGKWPKYREDMNWWASYERNLKLINTSNDNYRKKHGDKNRRDSTHRRKYHKLYKDRSRRKHRHRAHSTGRSHSRSRSRSRDKRRYKSSKRHMNNISDSDKDNMDNGYDNRENNEKRKKSRASMFNRMNDTNNLSDNEIYSIASTDSEIIQKRLNEHFYSDDNNVSNDEDPFNNLHDSINKNKKRAHARANKSSFTECLPLILTEQLAIEGNNGKTIKQYVQQLLGVNEFSNTLLKQTDKLASIESLIPMCIFIYLFFEYMKREYNQKRDRKQLDSISAFTYKTVIESTLKCNKPSAVCSELVGIFNHDNIEDIWNILSSIESRVDGLQKFSSNCVDKDFLLHTIDICDNENIYKSCRKKNKKEDQKCNLAHGLCNKCKSRDHFYYDCPKLDSWKHTKLSAMNMLTTTQCDMILNKKINLHPYNTNNNNNRRGSFSRGGYGRGSFGRGGYGRGRGRNRYY